MLTCRARRRDVGGRGWIRKGSHWGGSRAWAVVGWLWWCHPLRTPTSAYGGRPWPPMRRAAPPAGGSMFASVHQDGRRPAKTGPLRLLGRRHHLIGDRHGPVDLGQRLAQAGIGRPPVGAVSKVQQPDIHTVIIYLPSYRKVKGYLGWRADRRNRGPLRGDHQNAALLRERRAARRPRARPQRLPRLPEVGPGPPEVHRTAQAVGLTLGEIRGIIAFRERSSPPCTHVVSLIESRAADLDRRIVELRNLREELRRLARTSRTLSPDACSPDLVCHIINPAHRHEPFRAG